MALPREGELNRESLPNPSGFAPPRSYRGHMSIPVYQVLHVTAVILLTAITFQSCADPDEGKKRQRMILGGIASFVALVAGFGLLSKLELGFPTWMIIKLFCWLGIAGLSGAAYRTPGKADKLGFITAALVLIAVYCVYGLRS